MQCCARLLSEEDTMHVKVRASWALANLCDALRLSGFTYALKTPY